MNRRRFLGMAGLAATSPFITKIPLPVLADAVPTADPIGMSVRMVRVWDENQCLMPARIEVLYGLAPAISSQHISA